MYIGSFYISRRRLKLKIFLEISAKYLNVEIFLVFLRREFHRKPWREKLLIEMKLSNLQTLPEHQNRQIEFIIIKREDFMRKKVTLTTVAASLSL